MDQPDLAGQENAAPQIVHIDPVAELGEAMWLISCYRNRNLLLANDLLQSREVARQQQSLIEHLKAEKTEEAK